MLIISINKTERLAVTGLLPACHIMPPVNERSQAGRLRPDHPPPVSGHEENCQALPTVININRHLDDCLPEVKQEIDITLCCAICLILENAGRFKSK